MTEIQICIHSNWYANLFLQNDKLHCSQTRIMKHFTNYTTVKVQSAETIKRRSF